jgi:putative salt-induced outer membrane protein YdiY
MTPNYSDIGTLIRGALLILSFAFICAPAEAKRKDVVTMKNGDHLTGEVKKLESGVLYVDLDYVSGNVGLDWKQVDTVQTTGLYQIILRNGDHYNGTIEKSPDLEKGGKDVLISTMGGHELRVPASTVVQMETKKENFWRQLTGSINFGSSYTSGNNQTALNSAMNVTYPARNWAAGASYTSSFSGQSGASKTTNLHELQLGVERYLGRNSFVLGLSDFLHSSQQDLNLRTTLGGTYGRYVKRTNENSLRWFAGVAYTHEHFQSMSSQPIQQNVEALLGSQYELYRFSRYTLQSQVLVYPGLSDLGRIRTTTKTSLSVKLVNNFALSFSFWDNFDSRPPLNAKKNELGVSSNVGWTF